MSTADATSLYRHFAADGALLYVGIALSWPVRTRTHARSARWFEDVARVEIEHFPTREAALVAEREAIQRERPKFNVMHNRAPAAKTAPRKPRARGGDPVSPPSARKSRRDLRGGPLLKGIKGPDAVVGPALVYQDDLVSVIIAHGEFETPGELTEVVLGRLIPEAPEWSTACATVISIHRADSVTMAQARAARRSLVRELRLKLRTVEVFETDIALAVAYASRFPSEKSRRVLDEIADERGVAA